jgi:hypothetical protein
MTRTLDPVLVQMLLDSVATRFVTVEFVKKDGTISRANGLLRAASRLVGSPRGIAQGQAMKERGQIWIACRDAKTGAKTSKSFFLDRVTAIRCAGAKVEARA